MTFADMGVALSQMFGRKYPLPRGKAPNFVLYLVGAMEGLTWRYLRNNLGVPLKFDTSRSRDELGLTYRPVEETLRETVEYLEKIGLAR